MRRRGFCCLSHAQATFSSTSAYIPPTAPSLAHAILCGCFHPFANLFPLRLHPSSGTLGNGDLTTLPFDVFRCCFHESCPDGKDVHLVPTRCARRCGGMRHVREQQACDERRAGRICDVCEHVARIEAALKNRRRWVPTRGGGVQHPFACRPACRRLQGHLRLQPCSN